MTAVTSERGEGLTTVRVPLSATNDMIQSINAWMDDPTIDGDDLYDCILGHYAEPYSSAASSPATDEVVEAIEFARDEARRGLQHRPGDAWLVLIDERLSPLLAKLEVGG